VEQTAALAQNRPLVEAVAMYDQWPGDLTPLEGQVVHGVAAGGAVQADVVPLIHVLIRSGVGQRRLIDRRDLKFQRQHKSHVAVWPPGGHGHHIRSRFRIAKTLPDTLIDLSVSGPEVPEECQLVRKRLVQGPTVSAPRHKEVPLAVVAGRGDDAIVLGGHGRQHVVAVAVPIGAGRSDIVLVIRAGVRSRIGRRGSTLASDV
jgi:hypothetical protein